MRCLKCGRELMEEELFCPDCGTKAGEAGSVELTLDWEELRAAVRRRYEKLRPALPVLLLGLALLAVGLWLLSVEMFDVSYTVFDTSESMRFSMFQGVDFLRVFFCVAYGTAIACIALPLLTGKAWESWYFAPGVAAPIVCAGWLAYCWLMIPTKIGRSVGFTDITQVYDYLDIRYGLTVCGVLALAVVTPIVVMKAKNRLA